MEDQGVTSKSSDRLPPHFHCHKLYKLLICLQKKNALTAALTIQLLIPVLQWADIMFCFCSQVFSYKPQSDLNQSEKEQPSTHVLWHAEQRNLTERQEKETETLKESKQQIQIKRRIKDDLVEFSVDSPWVKLFKKALEPQRIDGHNLCASSLPPISETHQSNGFATVKCSIISCSYIHIGNRKLHKIKSIKPDRKYALWLFFLVRYKKTCLNFAWWWPSPKMIVTKGLNIAFRTSRCNKYLGVVSWWLSLHW